MMVESTMRASGRRKRSVDCMERKSLPDKASYSVLVVIIILIFLLNVNHMCRLEVTTPQQQFTLKLGFQKKPPLPEYFASPTRLYKPIPPREEGIRTDLVKPGDFIYFKFEDDWDRAPVIIESHKLIFFTTAKVGCTVWKQLFRRMMGYEDWMSQDETTWIPHNPSENGLKYLYDYTTEQASEMMTNPDWTRAIMVRDPKERFLSAFLDKAVSNLHKHIKDRCCEDESCVEGAQNLAGFLDLCKVCDDGHWRPQNNRMEHKYWPYIDVVGHVENAAEDAKALLQRIDAWDDFGASGWGESGNQSIFQSKGVSGAGEHATWAQWQVWKWYTPDVEEKVEGFFQGDYENPLFNFTRGVCLTCL